MEQQHLEAVKALIEEIADSYDLPDEEQVEEMNRLTGMDWDAEELQMYCFEYWSRSSLEETVYAMFHGTLPPTQEMELVFGAPSLARYWTTRPSMRSTGWARAL